MQAQKAKGAQLLGKALSIINIVADNPGRVRFDDIHAETGYSRPTLYRILGVLIQNGILRQDKRDQAYRIGLRFTELAFSRNIEADLSVIAGHELLKIFRLTGEAVSLGIFTEGHMTLIQRFEPSATRAWTHANPTRRPLHCTGLGKAYLSALPQAERAALLAKTPLTRYTPTTIVDPAALEDEIAVIQERGWSYENEEFIVGNCCVGVPLRARNGDTLGAVSVSAPVFRLTLQRTEDIAAHLKEAASAISLSLPERGSDSERLVPEVTLLGSRNFFSPVSMLADDDRVLIADSSAPLVSSFSDGQFSEECTSAHPIGAIGWRGNTLLVSVGKGLFPCRGEVSSTPLFEFSSPVKALCSDHKRRLWGSRAGSGSDHMFLIGRTQKPVSVALEEPLRIDALCVGKHNAYILDGTRRLLLRAPLDDASAKKPSLKPVPLFDLTDFPGTPQSIASSPDGSVWVCGLWSDVVYRISPDGLLTTTMSLPIPSATSCLYDPSSESILVATARLGLPLSMLRDNPYGGCLFSIAV